MNEESKSRREQQIENKLKEAMAARKRRLYFAYARDAVAPFPRAAWAM